ncbi:MAG TPA: hypothetical protein VM095_13720 [Pyrinomonadaceae bacterium]|nr:hypothetical protein [Pyrinomonadaceae bacterium]
MMRLLHTKFLLIALPRLHVHASGLGRALLVASLLLSAYALVSYWRNLTGRSRQVRYLLVSLRALSLLLVACALAGVSVDYESSSRARVLVRSTPRMEESASGGTISVGLSQPMSIRDQLIAALRGKGFEVVEASDDADALRSDGFVAAVLLTDGAFSAEEAEREVLSMNAAAGDAPVFVMAEHSPQGADGRVALENVSVLGRAVRGVPVAVRCTVHARGMRGRESLLIVSDDAKAQAYISIKWTQDDERQSVIVSLVPKVAGWIDYSAKVEAAGNENESLRTRAFSVYAEERRMKVLFFESEPTWEAKFIRRALEQSGLFEVDYSAQVSRAATVGLSQAAAEESEPGGDAQPPKTAGAKKQDGTNSSPEAKLRATLQSAAQLNTYDCVIVGATENRLLTSNEATRLREWVERRGGGLVVLGGNSFNGSIVAPGGKLYTLLPAETNAQGLASQNQEVSRGRPLEAEKTSGVVSLTPTEAGAGGALGGYLDASEDTAAATLTGQGLRLGPLRAGATALAVAGRAGANGTSDAGAVLIAGMRYGAGRTLLFAPADSWRIRTSASGNEDSAQGAFNALWQGLVLWTAAGARERAEIVLSDDAPAADSILTAEIHVRDAAYAPTKIEKLKARLQPLTEDAGDGAAASDSATASDGATAHPQPGELSFVPDFSDKSVWRARFPLRARGRFVLEAEYTAGTESGSLEKRFAVVAAPRLETGAALDTLRRVSRESGGELIEADPGALAESLAAIPSSAEDVRRTWELRDWWPLAFLVPLLLSVEWFLRRLWRID